MPFIIHGALILGPIEDTKLWKLQSPIQNSVLFACSLHRSSYILYILSRLFLVSKIMQVRLEGSTKICTCSKLSVIFPSISYVELLESAAEVPTDRDELLEPHLPSTC